MDFKKLVTPVVFAVAASIIAFIALVIFAAHQRDQESVTAEAKVIRQNIAAQYNALQVLADDNAWWDEAIENIVISENIEWIDRTIGDSVIGTRHIQGVMILRADGTVIYSNFAGALPAPHLFVDAGFGALAGSLPDTGENHGANKSGLIHVQDRLLAFGASRLTPVGIKTFDRHLDLARMPLLIFIAELSPPSLNQIGVDNAIKDLKFQATEQATEAQVPQMGPDGALIGYFTWAPTAPGSAMARAMIVPALILMMVVATAMMRFVRRADQLIDALAQANRSKSTFLASMSHEIRTPLNSILGFTELVSLELYGKVEGEKNKEYLKLIRQSGQHLLSIINDILDISKLEAGRFDIYAEKVNPEIVVTSCLKIVEPTAGEKNIHISARMEPASLESDERIMRQIILNILSNAVKFTDPGGTVKITGLRQSDGYLVEVKDNGIGMRQEDIRLALTLFGQVQNEYARSHRGTGLGLPLVSRFMALLDGGMTIESTPGEGTLVSLRFPLKLQAKNLTIAPKANNA